MPGLDDDDEEVAEQPAQVAVNHKRYLLFVGAGLVVLGVLAGVVVAFTSSPEGDSDHSMNAVQYIEDEDNVLSGAIVDLGDFTVNLGKEDNYLLAHITLEFFDFSPPHSFEAKKTRLRDLVIEHLSGKAAKGLIGEKRRDELKGELVALLNEELGDEENPVVQVYFTNFLIQ